MSLKDIDRLVDNGLRVLLDDSAISATSTAKSYRLSGELAVIAALSADQNNGRKLKLMDRVNQITSKQAELVELANNRSKEQDPALRREARRAYWNKSDQIDDARLEFVKTLPDSYRIEIRSVLTHYADEYVKQLATAAKTNPLLRIEDSK